MKKARRGFVPNLNRKYYEEIVENKRQKQREIKAVVFNKAQEQIMKLRKNMSK